MKILGIKKCFRKLTAKNQESLIKDLNKIRGELAYSSLIKYDIVDKLTTREKEILPLLFNDFYSYTDIANKLFITPKTVSKHASNIFKKTDTKNRKNLQVISKKNKGMK